MIKPEPETLRKCSTTRHHVGLAILAVIAFHAAYVATALAFLIALYLWCLFELRSIASPRLAFYAGLSVGLAAYAPHLAFFWGVFGLAAIALWLILAFWVGFFVFLISHARRSLPVMALVVLAPFLWTGLEYFRSELYPLRFSWLSVGYAFSWTPQLHHLGILGVYGIGFVLMTLVAIASLVPKNYRVQSLITMFAAVGIVSNTTTVGGDRPTPASSVAMAGVQLEFPEAPELRTALDQVVEKYPAAQLIVLSEYTLDGPVPDWIRDWCRKNRRYLILGGKDPAGGNAFRNTAFVLDPEGETVFKQGKSVPIQFFADGLPADTQQIWNSPWGRLGICICYDLSYTRVTDELVRQGAQAIVVPTMDMIEWGRAQHELHARVGPMRAAEYGLPIFRVCSSGISQSIGPTGKPSATAGFPGQGEMLAGELELAEVGRIPIDRRLAPVCAVVTCLVLTGFLLLAVARRTFLRRTAH